MGAQQLVMQGPSKKLVHNIVESKGTKGALVMAGGHHLKGDIVFCG